MSWTPILINESPNKVHEELAIGIYVILYMLLMISILCPSMDTAEYIHQFASGLAFLFDLQFLLYSTPNILLSDAPFP